MSDIFKGIFKHTVVTVGDQANVINTLQIRLDNLERKVRAQADYLSQLHQRISRG